MNVTPAFTDSDVLRSYALRDTRGSETPTRVSDSRKYEPATR